MSWCHVCGSTNIATVNRDGICGGGDGACAGGDVGGLRSAVGTTSAASELDDGGSSVDGSVTTSSSPVFLDCIVAACEDTTRVPVCDDLVVTLGKYHVVLFVQMSVGLLLLPD